MELSIPFAFRAVPWHYMLPGTCQLNSQENLMWFHRTPNDFIYISLKDQFKHSYKLILNVSSRFTSLQLQMTLPSLLPPPPKKKKELLKLLKNKFSSLISLPTHSTLFFSLPIFWNNTAVKEHNSRKLNKAKHRRSFLLKSVNEPFCTLSDEKVGYVIRQCYKTDSIITLSYKEQFWLHSFPRFIWHFLVFVPGIILICLVTMLILRGQDTTPCLHSWPEQTYRALVTLGNKRGSWHS